MPRQNPFSRKTATTYSVVYRPQDDPLIHDESTPDQILHEVSRPSASTPSSTSQPPASAPKVQHREVLEAEFGRAADIRQNEGEAAEHGVFFDDTKYDYMQHLRDLGGSEGAESTFIEAPQKGKGKARQFNLEDALRDVSLEDDTQSVVSGMSYAPSMASGRYSMTSSRYTSATAQRNRTYQDQQDVPDAIAGFQPDMDPRLREVLEALEDEAYVDDEDDVFEALTGEDAEELDQVTWEDGLYEDFEEDGGWESDKTEKPTIESKAPDTEMSPSLEPTHTEDGASKDGEDLNADRAIPPSVTDGDWLASFTKSKGLPKTGNPNQIQQPAAPPSSIAPSSILSGASAFQRGGKKRKGALTNPSTFSMSSSALARTEPLTTLDARFDKLAALYMNDDDDIPEEDDMDDTASIATATTNKTSASRISHMSSMSRASRASAWSTASGTTNNEDRVPQLAPGQFDRVLDDFVGGMTASKGRRAKKFGGAAGKSGQTGMQQLDEVRKGLGSARLKT